MGFDFFLLSFFVLCSGTAEDFFFDDPPLLALFDRFGVPFVGATAGLDVVLAASPAASVSFMSVSCVSDVGSEVLSAALSDV